MIYTNLGLMTSTDLEEWRQDTDWYALNRQESSDDECTHDCLFIEDCDECANEIENPQE
jgi:hypothetical protein